MTTDKKRLLKAKISLALLDEWGRQPTATEVEKFTLAARVLPPGTSPSLLTWCGDLPDPQSGRGARAYYHCTGAPYGHNDRGFASVAGCAPAPNAACLAHNAPFANATPCRSASWLLRFGITSTLLVWRGAPPLRHHAVPHRPTRCACWPITTVLRSTPLCLRAPIRHEPLCCSFLAYPRLLMLVLIRATGYRSPDNALGT